MGTPIFDKQFLTGAVIEWGHPQLTTFVQGGRYTNCEITIGCSARGIIIADTVFEDCRIRVKRPFKDYQFFQSGFERCHFSGRYPGCEFGFRNAMVSRRAMHGYVRDCDFAQATLDLVRLNGADLAGLRLPRWPHLVARSAAALAVVEEFAEDPEWSGLAELPWPPETTGLVVLYRHGGRSGFRMPAEQALDVLRHHNDITILMPNTPDGSP